MALKLDETFCRKALNMLDAYKTTINTLLHDVLEERDNSMVMDHLLEGGFFENLKLIQKDHDFLKKNYIKKFIKPSLVKYPKIQNAEIKFNLLVSFMNKKDIYDQIGLNYNKNSDTYVLNDYLLPQKQLCEILNVTRQSLNLWADKHYIKRLHSGRHSKKYYALSSIYMFLYSQIPEKHKRDFRDLYF